MSNLEMRLYDHLKTECGAAPSGEIMTKVDVLRQVLDVPYESVYPAIVSLRNKGLIATHKKGRLGMTVRVIREYTTDVDITVNYCPSCGRKVPSSIHRFCYNCGEALSRVSR